MNYAWYRDNQRFSARGLNMLREVRGWLVAAALALYLGGSGIAAASLIGDSVELTTSASAYTIDPDGGPFASVVDAGPEYTVCVNSTLPGCDAGLLISIDIGATDITFVFSGATGAPGSFFFSFSDLNFDPPGNIIDVS